MRLFTIMFFVVLIIVTGITLGMYSNVYAQQTSIPNWLKNTAKLWGEGQTSDNEFINSIRWLIDQKIIVIPSKPESIIGPPQQNQTVTSTQDLLPKQGDLGSQWNLGKLHSIKTGGSAGFVEDFTQTFTRNNSNETIYVEIVSYDSTSNAKKQYDNFVQGFQGSSMIWTVSPVDESIQDMCWSADNTGTPSQSQILCQHGNFFVILISMKDSNSGSKQDLNKFAEIILNKIWLVVNVNASK